jgi:hypothetical protein
LPNVVDMNKTIVLNDIAGFSFFMLIQVMSFENFVDEQERGENANYIQFVNLQSHLSYTSFFWRVLCCILICHFLI